MNTSNKKTEAVRKFEVGPTLLPLTMFFMLSVAALYSANAYGEEGQNHSQTGALEMPTALNPDRSPAVIYEKENLKDKLNYLRPDLRPQPSSDKV